MVQHNQKNVFYLMRIPNEALRQQKFKLIEFETHNEAKHWVYLLTQTYREDCLPKILRLSWQNCSVLWSSAASIATPKLLNKYIRILQLAFSMSLMSSTQQCHNDKLDTLHYHLCFSHAGKHSQGTVWLLAPELFKSNSTILRCSISASVLKLWFR